MYHVGQLVCHHLGHSLLVGLGGVDGGVEEVGLAVGDEAPVLHGPGGEVGNGDHVWDDHDAGGRDRERDRETERSLNEQRPKATSGTSTTTTVPVVVPRTKQLKTGLSMSVLWDPGQSQADRMGLLWYLTTSNCFLGGNRGGAGELELDITPSPNFDDA